MSTLRFRASLRSLWFRSLHLGCLEWLSATGEAHARCRQSLALRQEPLCTFPSTHEGLSSFFCQSKTLSTSSLICFSSLPRCNQLASSTHDLLTCLDVGHLLQAGFVSHHLWGVREWSRIFQTQILNNHMVVRDSGWLFEILGVAFGKKHCLSHSSKKIRGHMSFWKSWTASTCFQLCVRLQWTQQVICFLHQAMRWKQIHAVVWSPRRSSSRTHTSLFHQRRQHAAGGSARPRRTTWLCSRHLVLRRQKQLFVKPDNTSKRVDSSRAYKIRLMLAALFVFTVTPLIQWHWTHHQRLSGSPPKHCHSKPRCPHQPACAARGSGLCLPWEKSSKPSLRSLSVVFRGGTAWTSGHFFCSHSWNSSTLVVATSACLIFVMLSPRCAPPFLPQGTTVLVFLWVSQCSGFFSSLCRMRQWT